MFITERTLITYTTTPQAGVSTNLPVALFDRFHHLGRTLMFITERTLITYTTTPQAGVSTNLPVALFDRFHHL
ncbi:MAG: hypothetical protein RBR30_06950, partial [Tenuifilaceae bacterium]|nr:hypothetical protein [Tenuifilaceae bacterium]